MSDQPIITYTIQLHNFLLENCYASYLGPHDIDGEKKRKRKRKKKQEKNVKTTQKKRKQKEKKI